MRQNARGRVPCGCPLRENCVPYPEMDGINILTDVRHGTRRNSRYKDVVCIGAESHRVLRVETVTRADVPCAQKYELLGTKKPGPPKKRLFRKSRRWRECFCACQCIVMTDKNMTVQGRVRGDKDTEITNDTWHASV